MPDDATAFVVDRAAAVVEGELGQADAPIADAPKHETALDRLAVVRRHSDEAPVLVLEAVAHDLDRLGLVVSVNRDG